MRRYSVAAAIVALVASSAAAFPPAIDGILDAGYGPALSIQNTETSFGDSNLGLGNFANGSELDGAHGVVEGGVLYLLLTGNLESNYNKLELFIDSTAGGQSTLRGDNPNVDFNGLNRMAGLTFPAGFAADYWVSTTGGNDGNGNYAYFANYAELLTNGGGAGGYLGTTSAQSNGSLSGGTNPYGIFATIDNSNIGGVVGGNGTGSGANVRTGMEFAIPLSAIGNPTGAFCFIAAINGGSHDFLSNQVLNGLNGGGHLGDPSFVNLANTASTCVSVPEPGTMCLLALGALAALRRKRA